MYKRKLFLCLLTLGSLLCRAQVSMTLQIPPVGVLVKNQLWNMLLVNAGHPESIHIELVLLDEKTNQPVLTGTTMPFILDKGARQIQAKDLGPVQYTYSGPAVLSDRDPNGMLPVGNYQACYSIVSLTKGGPAAENCIQLAVDPLSPPLLNTPADEGNIYSVSPQFTWLPPTPKAIFGDLSYDLVLVEVLPGQGKADAIQQNIPIYSGGFLRDLYLNYPSSYRALDTSHLYAWRIVAMNNGQPVTMSDIWTFRVVAPPKGSLHNEHIPYLELKRGLGPSVATAGASLSFMYDNIPVDTLVHYTITSIQEAGNPVVQQGDLPLTRGRNLLQVPLTKSAGYVRQKIYLFQINNSRKETWTLKFTSSSK